jgi:hypothetical protein
MPIPPIRITLAGDPQPSSPTVLIGDVVQWQAEQDPITKKYPVWHICFSPFKGHVIKTDPATGLTPPMIAGQGIGSCSYKTLSKDPTLLSNEKPKGKGKRKLHIFQSGGGIIIDN